mgnify:FL=1
MDGLEFAATEKKQDPRVIHTKYRLQQALIQLLQNKDVKRVTVRELCETAQVHRSTFYMHYQDIYDLLEQVEQNTFDEIQRLAFREQHSSNTITTLMQYIQEQADLFQVLFRYFNSSSVQTFMQLLRNYFLDIWREEWNIQDPRVLNYRYVWIGSGIIGVIQDWLQAVCQDPPELVAGILWDMIRSAAGGAVKTDAVRIGLP